MNRDELIKRLEEGSTPDRELDALIYEAIWPDCIVAEWPCIGDDLVAFHVPGRPKHDLPNLTSSFDACIDLLGEVLPENGVNLKIVANKRGSFVSISGWKSVPGVYHYANHKDLCRAFLIAILKATETGS